MKYLKPFNELKEWKNLKPYHPYGSKAIQVSKVELNDICQKIDLDPNQVSYVASGMFGNAYLVGEDMVLKITLDKREAQMALEKLPNNSSITRMRNRCALSGKPRAFMREFNLSRMAFRKFALLGLLPGVKKASW